MGAKCLSRDRLCYASIAILGIIGAACAAVGGWMLNTALNGIADDCKCTIGVFQANQCQGNQIDINGLSCYQEHRSYHLSGLALCVIGAVSLFTTAGLAIWFCPCTRGLTSKFGGVKPPVTERHWYLNRPPRPPLAAPAEANAEMVVVMQPLGGTEDGQPASDVPAVPEGLRPMSPLIKAVH